MTAIESLLKENLLFKDIEDKYIKEIAQCTSEVQYAAGEFIFHEGEDALNLNIIRQGKVAIEVFAPKQGAVTIETIGRNEILGWSWFIPPYRRQFDAQAIEITRVLSIEAECLRSICGKDPALGYSLMQKLVQVIVERLQATRLQLMDIYRLQ